MSGFNFYGCFLYSKYASSTLGMYYQLRKPISKYLDFYIGLFPPLSYLRTCFKNGLGIDHFILTLRAIPFKNGEEGGRIFANFRDPPIQKIAFSRPPIQKTYLHPPPSHFEME